MAHPDIALLNAVYPEVPAVILPVDGGGTAQFDDTTITANAATAATIAKNKLAYVNSSLITGTWEPFKLIGSDTFTISTTNTTATACGSIACTASDSFTSTAIIWVHCRGQSGKRNGYFFGSDTFFVNSQSANGSTTSFTSPAVEYIRVNSDGTFTTSTGSYGVYGYSIGAGGTVNMRSRYNSSNTLTINDKFNVSIYRINLPTGVTLF